MDLKLDFEPKLFDPRKEAPRVTGRGSKKQQRSAEGTVYVYSSDIILAVNAALATQRPLLVMGPPGTGKSTLARSVASHLGWRFYHRVVTSRTQAQDLLWTFDALRRLRDAQANKLATDDAAYVQPGVLWWALDPISAQRRGTNESHFPLKQFAQDPARQAQKPHAVVLLDEIDKADPDVPNDLLGPIGEGTFEVTDTGRVISRTENRQVLLVITSNDERDLSPAFVRRCILLTLKAHGRERLVEIAREHFPEHLDDKGMALYNEVAVQVEADRKKADATGARPPSTAEFLDAVAACLRLGLSPASPAWSSLSPLVLSKFRPPPSAAEPI